MAGTPRTNQVTRIRQSRVQAACCQTGPDLEHASQRGKQSDLERIQATRHFGIVGHWKHKDNGQHYSAGILRESVAYPVQPRILGWGLPDGRFNIGLVG